MRMIYYSFYLTVCLKIYKHCNCLHKGLLYLFFLTTSPLTHIATDWGLTSLTPFNKNMDTTQVSSEKEIEGNGTSSDISLALSYEEEIEKTDTCDKEQGSLKINEILTKTAEVFLSSVKTEAETEPSKNYIFSDVDRDIGNGDERYLTKGLHQLMFEKVHKMKNKPNVDRNDLVENIKKDCVSLGARDENTGRTLLFHLLR